MEKTNLRLQKTREALRQRDHEVLVLEERAEEAFKVKTEQARELAAVRQQLQDREVELKMELEDRIARIVETDYLLAKQHSLSEEEIGAGCVLPPQRHVAAQIMRHWGPHATALQEPPSARCLHLRTLHCTHTSPPPAKKRASVGVSGSSFGFETNFNVMRNSVLTQSLGGGTTQVDTPGQTTGSNLPLVLYPEVDDTSLFHCIIFEGLR